MHLPPQFVIALVGLVLMLLAWVLLRRSTRAGAEADRASALASVTYARAEFLSPAEMAFFEALRTAVGTRKAICCKVRLADLVNIDGPHNRSAFNKLSQKHVDFVLCDPQDMRAVRVIELDDKSHQRAAARARDAFVDSVLMSAGIPITRVIAAGAYDLQELQRLG